MTLVATGLLCLAGGALLLWRSHPARVAEYVSVAGARGECSVRHVPDSRHTLRGARDTMACASVAHYLKDKVKLPAGSAVGVFVMDEGDPDTVRFIAELCEAGYSVSIGSARRVVFPI